MNQQKCFKCEGEGIIYPILNKKGFPETCEVCNGSKLIDGKWQKCPLCNGTGKIPEHERYINIKKKCTLCESKGYVDSELELEKCLKCNGEGKFWPFDGKKGVPIDCNNCKGKQYIPKTENEKNEESKDNINENENKIENKEQKQKSYENGEYYGLIDDNGKRNGEGVFYFKNGDEFIGIFKDDEFEKGFVYYKNGSKYEGYLNSLGKKINYGRYINEKGETFEGWFENDSLAGKVKIDYIDRKYTGFYSNKNENGYGIMIFKNKVRYEGNFKDGSMHGPGEIYYKDGRKAIRFIDKYHSSNDYIIYYFQDGKIIQGTLNSKKEDEFQNNYGYIEYPNGDIYFGPIKNWKKNGEGRYIYINGDQFIGKFKEDLKEGKGIMYSFSTSTKEVNNYKEDKPIETISKETTINKKIGKEKVEVELFEDDIEATKITYPNTIYYCGVNSYLEPNKPGIVIRKNDGKIIYKGDFNNGEYSGYAHFNKNNEEDFIGRFLCGYREIGVNKNKEINIFKTDSKHNYEGTQIIKKENGNIIISENPSKTESNLIFPNGEYYKGILENGKRNGQGKLYNTNNELIIGIWNEDEIIDKKIYYPDNKYEQT